MSQQVNSSFYNKIINSLSLNHGEGQKYDFNDFGYAGIVVQGMLGEGGPPFLLEASDKGLMCNDLEQRLQHFIRQSNDTANYCFMIRRANFQIQEQSKQALADALSNCLDLQYSVNISQFLIQFNTQQAFDVPLIKSIFYHTHEVIHSKQSVDPFIDKIYKGIKHHHLHDGDQNSVHPQVFSEVVKNFVIKKSNSEFQRKINQVQKMQVTSQYVPKEEIRMDNFFQLRENQFC